VLAIHAYRVAHPPLVRHRAQDVVRAFNAAGLATDNVQPIPSGGIGYRVTYSRGLAFTAGRVNGQQYYLLEFDTVAERDDVWDTLSGNLSRFAPAYRVKDNLILVAPFVVPAQFARYEATLAAVR